MITPELKSQWVAALRSGKYEQGQGCLRSIDDKFCCLGVICDIIDNSKWEKQLIRSLYRYTYESSNTYLPKGHNYIPYKQELELAHLNDSGRTFSEIADWIEENISTGESNVVSTT